MKAGKSLKYLSVFTLPALVLLSFYSHGWLSFLPLLYIFAFLPLLELFTQPDQRNHAPEQEEQLLGRRLYDFILYAAVPVQYSLLFLFFFRIQEPGLDGLSLTGRITAMGLMCGVFGINVAHELGHRSSKHEQWMAQALLLTSLYMHFFIEHNRGHHKNASTPEDPSTARKNESVYAFWLRSGGSSYISAWRLEKERLRKKGMPALHWHNQMLRFQLIQLVSILTVGLTFGPVGLGSFLAAAVMGMLLLETVNYIEHYGLLRKAMESGRYERVMPQHSWNSNHPIGRLMLFELSRHSDHHYKASRKYQILRHHEQSPQMPTGYPGMMVLSLLPPLWFRLMNPKIEDDMNILVQKGEISGKCTSVSGGG